MGKKMDNHIFLKTSRFGGKYLFRWNILFGQESFACMWKIGFLETSCFGVKVFFNEISCLCSKVIYEIFCFGRKSMHAMVHVLLKTSHFDEKVFLLNFLFQHERYGWNFLFRQEIYASSGACFDENFSFRQDFFLWKFLFHE